MPSDLRIRYTVEGGSEGGGEARLVDLSERGLRLLTGERLPVGTRLTLDLSGVDPADRALLRRERGIVVWSVQPDGEKSRFLVGFKYA